MRRRGRGAKTERERPFAGISVVDVQKLRLFFFAILAGSARPSAEIGVVKVQRLRVFGDLQLARATLCGGRCPKAEGYFLRFLRDARDPLRGSAWSRYNSGCFFLRFLLCGCDPLRGSCVHVRSLSQWCRVNLRISSRSARDRLGAGCKVATFKRKSSTRSASPQLELQSRNF